MFNNRDFLGKAYVESTMPDFSVGHWVANACRDEVKPHGHSEAHIMFITGGSFTTKASGESSKHHSLMIYNPPNTFHQDHFESDTGSFFTVSISADLIEEVYEIKLPVVPTIVVNPVSQIIVNKLMRECVQQQKDALPVIESLCFEVLGAIANYSVGQSSPKWLKSAFEILQDCYTEDLSIKDLSREVGVHPIHLTRTFQAFYRCTPGEFLRSCRTRKATELLVSTNLSLVEVAVESGFFDQSHFTKHFRRIFGVPPGEFRNLSNRSFLRESNVCFVQ